MFHPKMISRAKTARGFKDRPVLVKICAGRSTADIPGSAACWPYTLLDLDAFEGCWAFEVRTWKCLNKLTKELVVTLLDKLKYVTEKASGFSALLMILVILLIMEKLQGLCKIPFSSSGPTEQLYYAL